MSNSCSTFLLANLLAIDPGTFKAPLKSAHITPSMVALLRMPIPGRPVFLQSNHGCGSWLLPPCTVHINQNVRTSGFSSVNRSGVIAYTSSGRANGRPPLISKPPILVVPPKAGIHCAQALYINNRNKRSTQQNEKGRISAALLSIA